MITRSYDVIVAGFRPGGLLAGALLAKRGLRVLAINQDGRGPVRMGKYTFPSHRYPFIGFEDRELLGAAIDELTIHPTERKALQPSVPSFQVILPGQRVDVYPDDRFAREISREFPRDDVLIEGIYSRIKDEAGVFLQAWQARRSQPPRPSLMQKMGMGAFSRRDKALFSGAMPTLGQVMDQLEAPPAVRAFFYAQLVAFGYSAHPEELLMPVASHLLTTARAGIYGDTEHAEPLVNLLTDRLRSLHSDVVPQERITGLEFSWSKLQELTFLGYDQKFTCDFLIWNAPYETLLDVLPDTIRRKGYEGRTDPPEFERFSIHLALDEFVIPVGMQDHAILVADDEAPLQEGNLVYLTLSPEGAEAFAPTGTRAVTATTIVPATPEFRTREARRRVATTMLTHIKFVMPFMERYVRTLHVPMPANDGDVGDPVFDTARLNATFPGDAGPGPRLPHWNVFHLGRETYPLLGFEGEIGAGLLTADAVMAARKG